ncbi:MAG: hypothetical protein JSV09_04555, partial [Thermoplasmata archaeon]
MLNNICSDSEHGIYLYNS